MKTVPDAVSEFFAASRWLMIGAFLVSRTAQGGRGERRRLSQSINRSRFSPLSGFERTRVGAGQDLRFLPLANMARYSVVVGKSVVSMLDGNTTVTS